jgi:hypothetical protein
MHWASPPTYLALHEFGGEGLDSAAFDVGMEGDWDRKIREGIQSGKLLCVHAAFWFAFC